MLRVYYTELSERGTLDESALPLSAYRREKLRGVSSPLLRRQMLAAEHLLDQALLELFPDHPLPPDIRRVGKGKPFFASIPLCFSLSHSDVYVACAIADHEIGMDIQKNSVYREPLARRFFSPEERRFIEESPDRDAAFTEIWCLKESYIKATGEGLARPLSGFSLSLQDPPRVEGEEAACFWRFRDPRFRLAVCSLNSCEPVPDLLMKKS